MATILLPPDFKEFLRLLDSNAVDYLLVGGFAVSFHGYPRATGDMDVRIAVNPGNARKLVRTLHEFGFTSKDIVPELFMEEDRISRVLTAAVSRRIGAPSQLEATAVMLARKGPEGDIALSALQRSLAVEVVPMSVEASELARSAYARYGKGVGSPGVLNYGDCLAYDVAIAHGEPHLYTGDDFSQTDITPVPLA